jgi:Tfp pilus assembly protein PilX
MRQRELRDRERAMRRLLHRDDGIALVMALGIMLVLSIATVAMISYTSAGNRNSSVSGSRVTALTLAESGINAANSIITSGANASLATMLGCTASGNNSTLPCHDLSISEPGGTAYVHGLFTGGAGASGAWTITARGVVSNPTGGASLTKTLTATVSIVGGGTQNNISIWNYVFSTAPQSSGCEVDLSGTQVTIDVPLYVTGDLCLSGTQAMVLENTGTGGQPMDVRVGGTVKYTGTQTSVGLSTAKLTSGLSSGGCITPTNLTAHPCTTADQWWVKTTDTPITATPPEIKLSDWYTNASPGPKSACGGTAPVLPATTFDSDTTMNGTTPTFNLTPGSSYNCVTSTGKLSWNASTKVLTIGGTIFFDGNVTSSNSGAMYHGLATIYVNGTLSWTGSQTSLHAGCPASPATPTHQCAFADVSSEWDPTKDMLIFISSKTGGNAVNFSGSQNEFQGGLYCDSTSTANLSGTQTKVEGPIICGRFSWGTQTKLYPLPTITSLPPGAPLPPNAPATISPPVLTSG